MKTISPEMKAASKSWIEANSDHLAGALAVMHHASDAIYNVFPTQLRNLAALLHTLIEDECMGTEQTATASGVPTPVVADYRAAVGI